jgi:hypothetical protein
MGAFSVAFDIIIVGALALPWVLLVIDLFFSTHVSRVRSLLHWVNQQNQPAVAGVLLFAMAYSLGSAVSRIAQDFFDDDDLHLQAFHYLLRVGVTESSIRTDVFCNTLKDKEDSKVGDPISEKRDQLKTVDPKPSGPVTDKSNPPKDTNPNCEYAGRWIVHAREPDTHQRITAEWINDQEDLAGDIFHVHEATVLLKGTDPTERIRQFHDQIMVLRGAAFNGMVAFSLCLFWWFCKFKSGLRWLVLAVFLFPGAIATVNHVNDHPHNPPFMEFTLLVLAAAGWCVLWRRRPMKRSARAHPGAQNGRGRIRFVYLLLALFLTVSAFLGWWATQVLYDQQVIYSYKSLSESPTDAVTPNPK